MLLILFQNKSLIGAPGIYAWSGGLIEYERENLKHLVVDTRLDLFKKLKIEWLPLFGNYRKF